MSAAPDVRVHLSETSFDVLERPLARMCVQCLCGVAEFPWGFECGCGASFTLGIVGCAYTGGEETLLVEPQLPEMEPE
jgi:hypothetical protein